MYWHTSVIPALGRQRQESLDFKTSLEYTVKSQNKGTNKNQNSSNRKQMSSLFV